MSAIACIDPGKSATGIAIWDSVSWAGKVPMPDYTRTVYPRTEVTGWKEIDRILTSFSVERIYIEKSAFFAGGKGDKGIIAARKQDLVTLTQFIGGICGIASMRGIRVDMVPVMTWKGTLPKSVVKLRIDRVLKQFGYTADAIASTSHSLDAVGIGMFIMGHINTHEN